MRRGSRSSRPTLMLHALRVDEASPPGSQASTSENAPPPKVGLVVSRAVGGAVVRNRVARRLRHQVAERLDQLEPGTVLVIRAHPRAASASSATLGADLDTCLAALRNRQTSATTPGNYR